MRIPPGPLRSAGGMSLDEGRGRNGRSLCAHLRRCDFDGANRVLGDLSKAISSDDADHIRKVRGSMSEEMSAVGTIGVGGLRAGATVPGTSLITGPG